MLGRVAKVSHRLNLEILTPKQMLQRLPIALAQVKAGNTLKTCLMKSVKSYISFVSKKKKN